VDSTAAAVGAINGLIAYSYDGDIYVGDLSTGTSTAIVSGPESDINPKFSPDGGRIAFVRGVPGVGPASLIVVKTDGSDEHVVVPEDFNSQGDDVGLFAWTPDGSSIVVQIDFPPKSYPHGDGEIGLFDAAGVRGPLLLTPPLYQSIGGVYFNPSAQVAPMFRPPEGDLILSAGELKMFNSDLTPVSRLLAEALAGYEAYGFAGSPTWSPDGTRIVVAFPDDMVVMDAEGRDPHNLGPGSDPTWSPDGLSVASEDWGGGGRLETDEVRIAVHDLVLGTKRILESSVTPQKRGAAVQTITWNTAHTWYFEGWAWSPDGRSLLVLQEHLSRPLVIDVATDTATQLPWITDSFPSWHQAAVP
jgi:dipeptidyl aminopeptidase/acylaminoacyl peptidase